MGRQGPGLWDNPNAAIDIIPDQPGVRSIGSPGFPFKSIHAQEIVGATIQLDSGVNGNGGTVVVNGVTPVAVANTSITANSVVQFSLKTVGGTVGQLPHLVTITPGVGFSVAATALDSSTYNYAILTLA